MRKLKTTRIVALCLAIALISLSAEPVKKNKEERVSKYYKDITYFGLKDFVNMDLGLIAYFPTRKDWMQISKNIELIPIDSLRYIDSLDINQLTDTLYVKIYSQNYAYLSQNTYKILKNTNKPTDTLMLYNIDIDLKIKKIVENAPTFRTNHYSINHTLKKNIDNVDKRITIDKIYR